MSSSASTSLFFRHRFSRSLGSLTEVRLTLRDWSLLTATRSLFARSVDLEVSHELLLLCKHRLQSVQLSLQLLNRQVRFSLHSCGILKVMINI